MRQSTRYSLGLITETMSHKVCHTVSAISSLIRLSQSGQMCAHVRARSPRGAPWWPCRWRAQLGGEGGRPSGPLASQSHLRACEKLGLSLGLRDASAGRLGVCARGLRVHEARHLPDVVL